MISKVAVVTVIGVVLGVAAVAAVPLFSQNIAGTAEGIKFDQTMVGGGGALADTTSASVSVSCCSPSPTVVVCVMMRGTYLRLIVLEYDYDPAQKKWVVVFDSGWEQAPIKGEPAAFGPVGGLPVSAQPDLNLIETILSECPDESLVGAEIPAGTVGEYIPTPSVTQPTPIDMPAGTLAFLVNNKVMLVTPTKVYGLHVSDFMSLVPPETYTALSDDDGDCIVEQHIAAIQSEECVPAPVAGISTIDLPAGSAAFLVNGHVILYVPTPTMQIYGG